MPMSLLRTAIATRVLTQEVLSLISARRSIRVFALRHSLSTSCVSAILKVLNDRVYRYHDYSHDYREEKVKQGCEDFVDYSVYEFVVR